MLGVVAKLLQNGRRNERRPYHLDLLVSVRRRLSVPVSRDGALDWAVVVSWSGGLGFKMGDVEGQGP
jgi:hypothetical protein